MIVIMINSSLAGKMQTGHQHDSNLITRLLIKLQEQACIAHGVTAGSIVPPLFAVT